MLAPVPAPLISAWREGLAIYGRTVLYQESGGTARSIRARVVFSSAMELANSIEMYPIRLTVDARDFATRLPEKGDTVTIDGARRGVMQVAPVHVGEVIVGYRVGVAG
jgi:hypothetical protein